MDETDRTQIHNSKLISLDSPLVPPPCSDPRRVTGTDHGPPAYLENLFGLLVLYGPTSRVRSVGLAETRAAPRSRARRSTARHGLGRSADTESDRTEICAVVHDVLESG